MQGSIEAISSALNDLGSDEVVVRIIHSAVGAVSETDIALASASNAILLAFNVRQTQMQSFKPKPMASKLGNIQLYII